MINNIVGGKCFLLVWDGVERDSKLMARNVCFKVCGKCDVRGRTVWISPDGHGENWGVCREVDVCFTTGASEGGC